jgi:hypothetical protein
MRITKLERSNLARFGCTLLANQNLFCISWGREQQNRAMSANIVTRLIHTQLASGPVLSLAFEISCTRALARYCFLPFDLSNKVHTKYLSTIFKKGKIDLCFLAEQAQVRRVYDLSSRQCANMGELYAKVLADFKTFPAEAYDFDRAVTELEQNLRLVDYFQYVVTDSELRRAIILCKEKAAKVAPEDRVAAANIGSELLGVFHPRYELFDREFIKKIPTLRRNFLFMLDLQRQFEGDYEGFSEFLADVIAAHTPKEENHQLEMATLFFKSVFRLMDHLRDGPAQSEEAKSQFESDLRDLMTRVVEGQGLSVKALINLLSATGLPLGGQPGRTPKDYSSAYALKAAGQFWSVVAARTLENDSETREEFGGRRYDVLTFEEKELLKNRVREGVRSYAKRTGKPFPPQKETKLSLVAGGEQKNSP